MDIGSGGVYDSPMATDYYVKQFGFLFGGGRSGVLGVKAMQDNQDRFHRFHRVPLISRRLKEVSVERKTVELAPLRVESKSAKPLMFHRYMAVP